MGDKRSISVILPNYNGEQLLKKYLPFTIEAIKNAGVLYEIIVVDDASKDESAVFIGINYPQIKLIINPKNSGFSHTCNAGIGAAKYELIFLLNTDVKLTPDYFEHQFHYFENPETFGVMGRIIDMEGEHIQDAARTLNFKGFKLKTNRFFYAESEESWVPTAYLSGANALIDAKKIKEIGGFNELFSPFYGEDLELGLRAWRLGWYCWYEHQSVCRHQISATTRNYQQAKQTKIIYQRNRFFVHAIHLNGFKLIGWYLQIFLLDLIPQILTGKFWQLQSYRALISYQSDIRDAKKAFNGFMKKSSVKNSIGDVATKLLKMRKQLDVINL